MRHRRIAIWAGAVAATLAGTAGMTGCGAGATKKTAGAVSHADAVRAVLTRATDRTGRLGSAEVKMTMDMGPGSTPATMTGTYSWRGGYALGRAPVNGRSATHYTAVIDRAHKGRLEEAFDGENALLDSFFVMADSITTDVWVDAEGLPVRLAQKISNMRVTMDFAKFGATAGVEAPPAARTGDMTEELRAAAQQQS